jgi:hypothetical protein
MDGELLLALIVLWITTTVMLVTFFRYWFHDKSECFHAHCVDTTYAHNGFMVVSGPTTCKHDCVVKSISVFVAPRGSSSSKYFSVMVVIVSCVGMLGSHRWHKVGDATAFETYLAIAGFAALLLVSGFELDVASGRFLEDKLMITAEIAQRIEVARKSLGLPTLVFPFELEATDEKFKKHVLDYKELNHLYPEAFMEGIDSEKQKKVDAQAAFYGHFHIIGAVGFVVLVTAAIIVNEIEEVRVGWLTGISFFLFCSCCYLSGNYMYVLHVLRGWVLVWNPWFYEPDFINKLHNCLIDTSTGTTNGSIVELNDDADKISPSPKNLKTRNRSRSRSRKASENSGKSNNNSNNTGNSLIPIDSVCTTPALRFAQAQPKRYLLWLGWYMVMTEVISFLTPAIAIGIQWITATCDGPPIPSILEYSVLVYECHIDPFATEDMVPASWYRSFITFFGVVIERGDRRSCDAFLEHCIYT